MTKSIFDILNKNLTNILDKQALTLKSKEVQDARALLDRSSVLLTQSAYTNIQNANKVMIQTFNTFQDIASGRVESINEGIAKAGFDVSTGTALDLKDKQASEILQEQEGFLKDAYNLAGKYRSSAQAQLDMRKDLRNKYSFLNQLKSE